MSLAISAAVRSISGYSPWSLEKIGEEIQRGTLVSAIPGDFVFTECRENGDLLIASSALSAIPYFFSTAPGGGLLAHGPNSFDVAGKAGLPWQWNDRAVACIGLLGHTVGDDTLHPNVRRFPPDAILRVQSGRTSLVRGNFWEKVFSQSGQRAVEAFDEAVAAFQMALAEMPGPNPYLSLSAGFDSRLLLAGMLRAGVRPVCVTVGGPESTDARIASAITHRFGLEHRLVELRAEDYLSRAAEIVGLTGGTKGVAHWHTYLYPLAAKIPPGATHFVGANGEFARTYYFDKGILALMLSRFPKTLLRPFFSLKYFDRGESRLLRRHLLPYRRGREARSAASLGRFLAEAAAPGTRFLDSLDDFYATQRVRHFIGNGLALYNAVVPTRSPFLDSRWVRAAARLPRGWKLGSRFHREAIFRLFPELLDFPVSSGERIGVRPPLFYWLRQSRFVGYSPFPKILDGPEIRDLLISSENLEWLVDRRGRETLVQQGGVRTKDFLLTMHFVAGAVKEFKSEAPDAVASAANHDPE